MSLHSQWSECCGPARWTRCQLVAGPKEEPVGLPEAREQCNVYHHADDGLLGRLITAARDYVEQDLWRALISQDYDVWYNGFGRSLEVPVPPLRELHEILYFGADCVQTPLSPTVYELGYVNGIAHVRLQFGQEWPRTRGHQDDVRVRITAGYGPDPSDVPPSIRHAILLVVAHLYENRESTAEVQLREIPQGVEALLAPFRIRGFV